MAILYRETILIIPKEAIIVFPKLLNTCNFTMLAILNYDGGGVGTGKDGSDGDEANGGVDGGGIHGILSYQMNRTS